MGLIQWFKKKMFSAKSMDLIGTIVADTGKSIIGQEIRVYSIEPTSKGSEKSVGLEIVSKSPLSYQMLPVRLSKEASAKLQELLGKASAE
jgi:hypothetical protein